MRRTEIIHRAYGDRVGTLHAVLYRDWKSRVKGRDFYDFVRYVSRDVPVNLVHLEARMRVERVP